MNVSHRITLAGAGFFRPHWHTLVSIAPADPAPVASMEGEQRRPNPAGAESAQFSAPFAFGAGRKAKRARKATAPAARKATRADWLASPWSPPAGVSFGVPTGAELRAQRKRQAEREAERLKCATDEARAFVREGARRAARDGIGAGPDPIAKEVRRFAAGLARRLCDGASMRGHAHLRTTREGYRKSNTVAKYWGDMQRQCASEIESALWFHSGVLLSRYGMPSLTGERPGREAIAILRAIRSRFVVIHSLRAGERILRRMSHRTNEEAGAALTGRADEGATAARWQPAQEAVAQLREAIRAGARNAPTAARMLALLDSILAGRPPAGVNAARQVGRLLAMAEAGGFSAPDSWRAYCGARKGGRPALATV